VRGLVLHHILFEALNHASSIVSRNSAVVKRKVQRWISSCVKELQKLVVLPSMGYTVTQKANDITIVKKG
jgi:hypothetical protein